MRVMRGRAGTLAADRERSRELVASVREAGEPGLRVWRPPPHVSFGRRDAAADGYAEARHRAEGRGYPTLERSVGGRPVAFTGETVAVVYAVPRDDTTLAIADRYDRVVDALQTGVETLDVTVEHGEPECAFCPGTHSLTVPAEPEEPEEPESGKVVGVAQRVRQDVALVAGIALTAGRDPFVDVLEPVYDALDVPLDPDAVGSLSTAGSPGTIADAVADALADLDADAAAVRET
jgi:octanoyl-[GcvH]:protein N-octanoyltransferase